MISLKNEIRKLGIIVQDSLKTDLKGQGVGVITLKGDPGKDGKTPTKESLLEIINPLIPLPKEGKRGIQGMRGKSGKTPRKGVEYFTKKEVATIVEKILKMATPIKGVHYQDGRDGVTTTITKTQKITLNEILNMLDGEITTDMIDGLEEYIKKIAGSSIIPWVPAGNAGSGGSSTITTVAFVTETPDGLINGSNKLYTTTQNISAIISFAINGQFIHPTDYAFLGKQISFITALDSSLSGLPFTITYIPK